MDANELRRLISLELDGEISPEDEAVLMDEVSRDPALAEEYRAWHALRRGFRSFEKPSPPAGLADRIARRVLEGPPAAGKRMLFRSLPAFRMAAGFLLILSIGGVIGWYLGQGDVAAGPRDGDQGEARIERSIQELLHLDGKQLREWTRIGQETQRELDALGGGNLAEIREELQDLMLARRLHLLDETQRRTLMNHMGLSREEMDRLLRLSRGR